MTPYTPQDVAEHWEFKILRSATTQFRDPLRLRGDLEEEARAGWTMIEKFDDSRVRLKRPASARATDATLGFDPYRTWVGYQREPARAKDCARSLRRRARACPRDISRCWGYHPIEIWRRDRAPCVPVPQ